MRPLLRTLLTLGLILPALRPAAAQPKAPAFGDAARENPAAPEPVHDPLSVSWKKAWFVHRFSPAEAKWTSHESPRSPLPVKALAAVGPRSVAVVDPDDQFGGRLFDVRGGRWMEIPPSPVDGPGLSGDAITCTFVGDDRLVVWGRTGHVQGAVLDTKAMKWSPMAAAPIVPRYRCAVASAGGKLFVWGGYGPLGPGRIGPLEDGAVYDVGTNTWEKMPGPPVPGHRYGVSACVWNDRFVLFGVSGRGVRPLGTIFDPATRTWEKTAECPFDVGVHSAASVAGDRLFLWSGSFNGGGGGGESPDAAAYDFRTRKWQKLPDAPIPPRNLASARANGSRVTVWGGWTSDRERTSSLRDGATYDFDTGAWEKIASLPAGVPYELHPGW